MQSASSLYVTNSGHAVARVRPAITRPSHVRGGGLADRHAQAMQVLLFRRYPYRLMPVVVPPARVGVSATFVT
jgi:hypothetical protein